MEDNLSPGLLDELDGLNPTRALVLQSYYALRRLRHPSHIGTHDIALWIKAHEPAESMPSDSLIHLTLMHAKVPHRPPGRPRRDDPTRASTPLLSAFRMRLSAPGHR